MKKKGKINHSVQEGIFFLLAGAALLGYAVTSYGKAFNKDWGQSPYLFPLMVAAAFMVLALCLVKEGISEWNKTSEGEISGKPAPKVAGNWKGIITALALCIIYYMALIYVKLPYITVGIFTFFFTFSTFEVATWVFLVAMMAYMEVRKPVVLAFVPLGVTLFLSIAFRTMLNVLLP